MFKKFVAAVALLALTSLASAAPVTVKQVFTEVALDDYGFVDGLTYGHKGTGEWIFQATLDTDAPNVYPWPAYAGYYKAKVTLTQASLGLHEAVITNLQYFFMSGTMMGFTAEATGGAPWTRMGYGGWPVITDHFPLVAGDVFSSTDRSMNTFGPQWSGFIFENGAHIYGWGYNALSTISVSAAAAVPEPASMLLFAGALAGLAGARRRRRQA